VCVVTPEPRAWGFGKPSVHGLRGMSRIY
jgi:hypothetical protein